MTNEELLYNIHYWEKEKMDALVEHAEKEEARKRVEEGIAEGRETSKIEMIKNLLLQNVNYDIISNASGKTIEEIKEIEKNMN